MSSYVDVNYGYRRTRLSRPVDTRRVKVAAIIATPLLAFAVLSAAAYGGGRQGTETITVGAGQTVWSIAQARYPEDDTRARVADIIELNQLGSSAIYPGERLQVPAR